MAIPRHGPMGRREAEGSAIGVVKTKKHRSLVYMVVGHVGHWVMYIVLLNFTIFLGHVMCFRHHHSSSKVGLSMDQHGGRDPSKSFYRRWRRSSERRRIWWQSACGRKPLARLEAGSQEAAQWQHVVNLICHLSLTGGYDGKKRVEETLGHVKLYELWHLTFLGDPWGREIKLVVCRFGWRR